MQQFLQKHGKALDLSSAFLFALLGIFASYSGVHLLSLALLLGAIAWFASWRAWSAPDAVEVSFNRTMCAIMVVLSALTFVASFIFEGIANV